jgi:LAO/AO transport system kinase
VTADKSPEVLAQGIVAGQRRALAKAITLSESSRADHRALALDVLERLGPERAGTMRLGISGPPGVGKSTFIEAFGIHAISCGHRVAVLAVDPSSVISGGSILGDKTRMEALARDSAAFIRPSPAGRTLGGVARRTHEAMLLCEASGFDVIMIETVGVGQSETMVADMTDALVLLLQPGGGDDLQGIKRGIVELAPIVVVNKADGALKLAAEQTALDYGVARAAQGDSEGAERFPVQTCSALTGEGLPEVWQTVEKYHAQLRQSGELAARRGRQRRQWLWTETAEDLLDVLRSDPAVKAELHEIERAVISGKVLPMTASRRLLDVFLRSQREGGSPGPR